jgi:hypothetical protein
MPQVLRRDVLTSALGVALSTMLPRDLHAGAGSVFNEDQGVRFAALDVALAAARPGDVLTVNGRHVGNFVVSKAHGRELFVLRNLSRGKGIGFFEDNGFYPDFIIWVMHGKNQRVIFVEPHGMRMEEYPTTNHKINLHLKLKEQVAVAKKTRKLENIELDSYIISATPYDDLRKHHGSDWDEDKYAAAHVLFFSDQRDLKYISKIVTGN